MTRRTLVFCLILGFAAACGDTTSPPVATTVTVTPALVTLDAIGATQALTVTVLDQHGQPMSNAPITWVSSAPTIATVAAASTPSVSALANGSAVLTATVGNAKAAVTVNVAQVPASFAKDAGDAQTGAAGSTLSAPLKVVVLDRMGVGMAGLPINFAIARGNGSLASAHAVTGSDGRASVNWSLGTRAADAQEVTAQLAQLTTFVHFTATSAPGPLSSLTVSSGNSQLGAPSTTLPIPPAVLATDTFGNVISGAVVTFAVTSGGGSAAGTTQSTNSAGIATIGNWTLGAATGQNTLTATAGSAPPVTFSATSTNTPTATTLSVNAGSNQAAMVATALPVAPSVQLRTSSGAAVVGQQITFTVTGGGGTITGAVAVTDVNGIATAGTWTLGLLAGPNTLSVASPGTTVTNGPIIFTAVGCSGGGGTGYAITICPTTSMTATQRAAFDNAAARWGTLITADVPDTPVSITSGACSTGSPRVNMTVDDLIIFAAIEPIDGVGSILGSAGWCFRRTAGLPLVGLMRFDVADVNALEATNRLGAVILHEMGHVLGIGTMWTQLGLLKSPSSAGSVIDTYFSGAGATIGFDAIGGATYTAGLKVPVENTGGSGTINAHWRESVLQNELMTGFLNNGTNPLSELTVRSLADIGYSVNVAGADPLFLALALRAGLNEPVFPLGDDTYTGPQYTVDLRGRILKIR